MFTAFEYLQRLQLIKNSKKVIHCCCFGGFIFSEKWHVTTAWKNTFCCTVLTVATTRFWSASLKRTGKIHKPKKCGILLFEITAKFLHFCMPFPFLCIFLVFLGNAAAFPKIKKRCNFFPLNFLLEFWQDVVRHV